MIGLTLGRYLSGRFLQQILVVFLSISALSFLIDFVEMLRRSADSHVGAGFVAFMSFLRMPVASEQILPFAVLFGTMVAFVNLTRTLELVVARASGVSVWGFLVPPLAIALLIGLASVFLYNPLAAAKSRCSGGPAPTRTPAYGCANAASTAARPSRPTRFSTRAGGSRR